MLRLASKLSATFFLSGNPLIQDNSLLRLDVLLVERKLAKSRTHAKKLITENKVTVSQDGITPKALKPSLLVDSHAQIDVAKHHEDTYVSRAGLKLEAGLRHASINVNSAVCLDIGQSTGGFTDCLLQHKAAHVVGVEVGHSQLNSTLKADSRVTCIEGCNARNLNSSSFVGSDYSLFNIAVMDVSFISQTLIIPNIANLLTDGAWFVSLVKPQFEVGKAGIGKGGIVKNTALYDDVRAAIITCVKNNGFDVHDYISSPIVGGDGNKEFLLVARKQK